MRYLLPFFLLGPLAARAQADSSAIWFAQDLDSMHMHFVAPEGFQKTEPIMNRQFNWGMAFKHPTERFEVRYALRADAPPMFQQMFEMTGLNISGGNLPKYTPFDDASVKSEFGADAGAVVTLVPIPEFGQDYKYCLFIFLHKQSEGDAYIFFMADDNTKLPELMKPLFHNLRFAE